MLPELAEDIILADELFETRSRFIGRRGGGGHRTIYIASERKVVYRYYVHSPVSRRNSSDEKVLWIPDNILTEKELRSYVSEHQPGWI